MRHSTDLTARSPVWRASRRGSFILRNGENEPLEPLGRKARAILAYLAIHQDTHVSRDRLIELLWADRGEEQARGSLRQSLFEIRRVAPELIGASYQHVWIESALLGWDDATPDARDAVLFSDLDGITSEFDEWLRAQRSEDTSEEWSELERQAEALIRQGQGSAARPLIERMKRLDPYNEDWLRLAMRAEAQVGHPAAIKQRYAEFAEILSRELSVAPALETRKLRDQLLAELTAERPASVDESDTHGETTSTRRVVSRRNPWLVFAGCTAMLASLSLTQSATNARAVPIPSIAVLPFEAVGIEPALADGFSDELLTQLVRNRGLRVVGRTAFKDVRSTPEGLKILKTQLGVEYIVEGRVSGDANQLRVLVSLVRTKDAKTMWAENFADSSKRLQTIQASIGSAVGRSLSANAPPPFARKTTSGEAYNFYLRAKGLIRDRNTEGFKSAAQLLDTALRLDPKFAAAWAQRAAVLRISEGGTEFADPTRPGAILTVLQGAQRALELDPNLAEAHALMSNVRGFDTALGRAHIRRALALDPHDPQILYWAGIVAQHLGNFKLQNEYVRQSAALDPLWKRPVLMAATTALENRHRDEAERYLKTIKTGNPEGAVEVEIGYEYAEGDFSSAAAVATKDWVSNSSWDAGKNMAKEALLGIGMQSTPFGPITPVGRRLSFGRMPDRDWILTSARDWAADGADVDFQFMTLWALARERRWKDIEALFDQGAGSMHLLLNGDPGGRYARISFGGITALALRKVGRDTEAVKLALATDEAVKFALATGEVPAEVLASIAQDEAVLGHRESALTHLEQAFAKGWRMFLYTNRYMDPAEDPTFATLRGDPRFERINHLIKASKAQERREYLAFMNLSSWRDS